MAQVKYSIVVHAPTDDIPARGKEQIHLKIAVDDLDALFAYSRGYLKGIDVNDDEKDNFLGKALIPSAIIGLFHQTEQAGEYRCEVIQGGIKYAMYIQPNHSLLDREGKANSTCECTEQCNAAPAYVASPVIEGDALGVTGSVDNEVEHMNPQVDQLASAHRAQGWYREDHGPGCVCTMCTTIITEENCHVYLSWLSEPHNREDEFVI